MAAVDTRFAKYPRLPVLNCDGHSPVTGGQTEVRS
jgi:hypothetical protein